jgi:osmotically-inducible protein OsmY
VVTLSGTLPTPSSCIAAVEDAEDVAGVRRVKNYLKVPVPEMSNVASDDEIKMMIESMLRWNPNIVAKDIDVSVVMGEVTLEGAVPTYWEKIKAEKIALEAAGSTRVINQLAVVPTRDYVDEAIAEDIIAAIDRNINIDAECVNVKVERSVVSLSGNVPDFRAYRAAYNVAANTSGVLNIVNDIKIGAPPQS